MNYKLYVVLMWVFSPVIALLSKFIPSVRVAFPVWLLFRNKYPVAFVIAQSSHESAIWTSDLYKRANNAFGMKPSIAKKYQDGQSGAYASYKHVWKSVYDYYDLVMNRMPSEGRSLMAYPSAPYNKDSEENNRYVKGVSQVFKNSGYYGAPYDTYTAAVWLHTKNIGPLVWVAPLVIGLWLLIPIGACFLIRYFMRSHGFKRSYKKR